jgi:hypothetical protein
LAYVPKSKPQATSVLEGDESTFQQQKYDPNKITKPAEEEWDQSAIAAENVHRICLFHPETFFSTFILELRGTKLNKI